jgi:hypothetical protein
VTTAPWLRKQSGAVCVPAIVRKAVECVQSSLGFTSLAQ